MRIFNKTPNDIILNEKRKHFKGSEFRFFKSSTGVGIFQKATSSHPDMGDVYRCLYKNREWQMCKYSVSEFSKDYFRYGNELMYIDKMYNWEEISKAEWFKVQEEFVWKTIT